MFTNRIYIQAVLLLAIALFIASCGGSSNVGVFSAEEATDSRETAGVTLGDFEVLRHNTDGFTDPALNDTLELSLEGNNLVISVVDGGLNAVAIDVKYNKGSVHPGSVEFSGLLGSEEEVLSASVHKNTGIIGLASIPIGGADVGSFNGKFASIAFPAGVSKSVSAVGDVHHGAVGQTHLGVANLFGGGDPLSKTASVSWTTAFHTGDGDQNSETNISDLTPIAIFFGQNTATNWLAAVADYDENTEVNLSDIQRLTLYYLEGTEAFGLAFADDDGSGKADYPGGEILWGDRVDPAAPPVGGDFFTAFDSWTLDINEGSAFSYADLAAFDANGDGFVTAYVRNIKNSTVPPQMGIESSVQVPVSSEPDETWANVTLLGYEVEVLGDALVSEGMMGADFTAGVLKANLPADFSLNNVYGLYEGEHFDFETFPTAGSGDEAMTMTQADYDAIFAACQAALIWTFSDGGHVDIRRTASWINLATGTGDPGTGNVFPDDDPQSGVGATEGNLLTLLPNTPGVYPETDMIHVSLLGDIDYALTFDIVDDPNAAILSGISLTEFELVIRNDTVALVTFGSGIFPVDPATSTALQLIPIQEDNWAADPTEWIEFDYNAADADVGEFLIIDVGDGTGELLAVVNGGALSADTQYAFRLSVDGVWSSINKPDSTIGTRPFQAPEIKVLPEICGPDIDLLQLFPSDPKVRRNGEMTWNQLMGTPVYANEDAYFDVLKDNTELDAEFLIEYDSLTTLIYPDLCVVRGASPSVITGPNDLNREAGVQILVRQGNKLIVDIATLPRPLTVDDPTIEYAFRIFTKDGTAFGEGTFTCPFLDFPVQDPIAVDWSVNLWDRVEGSVDDINTLLHDAGGALVDGTTVPTLTPDVLWFEFSGGWVFGGPTFDNVSIRADEVPPGDFSTLDMEIEIAGLTIDKHFIGLHTIVVDDFFYIGNEDGLFRNGGRYQFTLFDALASGSVTPFTRIMTVSGTPF